jgi:hypothetical protein
MARRRALAWFTLALLLAGVAVAPAQAAPLLDSPCPSPALLPAAFTQAALAALQRLAVVAPGQPADGAIRTHHTPGHVDPQGRAWQRVSAYPANLGLLGALHASASALPLAEAWLRWQARHLATPTAVRGVITDHWVRSDTLEESPCPPGLAAAQCQQVDAHDSTAASLLLAADAFHHHGGASAVLHEPPLRQALQDAADAMARLDGLGVPTGLTVAKPDHRVAYTMDQVEVAAGWRAWSRLLGQVYAQPQAAARASAAAARTDTALRRHLALPLAWRVSLHAGPPQPARWYPDTMAQAWPLLWLPAAGNGAAAARWQHAIAPWQITGATSHWAQRSPDPDGFWWPAVAVAAWCVGETQAARSFTQRAHTRLLEAAEPFAWPFQVGDLLWLLWLAEPLARPATPNSLPAAAVPAPPLSAPPSTPGRQP